MPVYRCQVRVYRTSIPAPEDSIVNVFYLNDQGLDASGETDPQNLAEDITSLWSTFRTWGSGYDRVEARLYDMAAPVPRPQAALHTRDLPASSGEQGPREVCLCLSFYSERNLPRQRGRLYIGPWTQSVMEERPPAALTPLMTALAQGLQDLGGIDVDWSIWSTRDARARKVTNWWVDNEWDTQRRRGLAGTSRTVGTTSE